MLAWLRCNSRVVACSAKKLATPAAAMKYRGYHFGTAQYYAAFEGLPKPDTAVLRSATLEYLQSFDDKLWFTQPIRSVVNGKALNDGELIDTVDAQGKVNGKQIVGNDQTFQAVVELVETLTAEAEKSNSAQDFREAMGRIEQKLLSPEFAAQLVGNQALDFLKQDGITEIEESVMANAVERKMNLELRADEEEGHVIINRHPALVACVSNFTNFLDLFRKTVRNIELGVPVVVLSRSNTSQHCFRWFEILQKLMEAEGLPTKLLSFASLSLEHQRSLFRRFPKSPVYFTGSREVAKALKQLAPKAISSTGGPNTMVNTAFNDNIAEAIRMSACIENSGQCTALRHVVQCRAGAGEEVKSEMKERVFASLPRIDHPSQSLQAATFFSLFKGVDFKVKQGYEQQGELPVGLRAGGELPAEIEENWREVYLDLTVRPVTDLETADPDSEHSFLRRLSRWLLAHQPISLAVNGPYELGLALWERTSQVVFTQGSPEEPALSCQARPQEGECFGEFAPRLSLLEHSRFPVVIPSPTPAYNAAYAPSFLADAALQPLPQNLAFCTQVVDAVGEQQSRGFCKLILQYLAAAAEGPWEGKGARTCLFGVQRTPLGGAKTVLRCGATTSWDAACPSLLAFFATNAREALELSVAAGSPAAAVAASLDLLGITVVEETEAELERRVVAEEVYNVVRPEAFQEHPMPGQFVSTLLCVGHCKSVRSDDAAFLALFRRSPKWIRIAPP